MKITFSQKILSLVTVILALILIGNIVLGNMTLNKISAINDKINQLTISTEERERAFTLKDSLSNSEADRQKLESYFVGSTDADTADFISYIENLAKQNNLSYLVRDVSYQPIPDLSSSDHVNFINFKLNVTGSWSNIFNFIQIIENLPKLVFISAVSIDNGPSLSSRTGAKVWSLELEFSVARLKN